MSKNKPIKAFEIHYLGRWYYIEIYTSTKVEVYTEHENLKEEEIKHLVSYLKVEGFLELHDLI
jgi:hypothetical protein